MNPFTTVAQKAIIVVLGLLIAVLGTAAGMLWFERRSLQVALADCTADKGKVSAALGIQNQAVIGFQQAASAATATSLAALQAARTVSQGSAAERKRLADLLAAAKSTECGPAMAEIREGLR